MQTGDWVQIGESIYGKIIYTIDINDSFTMNVQIASDNSKKEESITNDICRCQRIGGNLFAFKGNFAKIVKI